MAKRKQTPAAGPAGGEEPKRGHAVEIRPAIMRKVKMIAGALDLTAPAYINERLAAVVDDELPRILAALNLGPEAPKK